VIDTFWRFLLIHRGRAVVRDVESGIIFENFPDSLLILEIFQDKQAWRSGWAGG